MGSGRDGGGAWTGFSIRTPGTDISTTQARGPDVASTSSRWRRRSPEFRRQRGCARCTSQKEPVVLLCPGLSAWVGKGRFPFPDKSEVSSGIDIQTSSLRGWSEGRKEE